MWCKCTGNLNAVFATVFPRIIAGAVISVFVSKGGDYLREGDYLKLLTGSLALIKCSKFSYLINFQSLDCHWSVLLADSSSTWQAGNKRKRGVQGAIIRGRQLIEGWLLLEEIRYIIIHWNFPVFRVFLGGISIRSKMVWVSSIVFMNLVWCGAVASQLLPLLLEGLNGGVHLSVKIHLLCR